MGCASCKFRLAPFLRSYDETVDGGLIPPRSLADTVASLTEQAGSRLEVIDERAPATCGSSCSQPRLPDHSRTLWLPSARRDLGVLVAPRGASKTVIACSSIAERATSTLVLVGRETLADQWRTRISELLVVKAGQRGGGRTRGAGRLSKDVSCSTWDESCAHIREKPPQRYTTTTTSTLVSLPRPWPSARQAIRASVSPTPVNRHHGVDHFDHGVRCPGST